MAEKKRNQTMDESQEKSHYSNFFFDTGGNGRTPKKATQGAEQENNPQEHRRVTGKSFIGDIKVVITPPIENIQRKGSETGIAVTRAAPYCRH